MIGPAHEVVSAFLIPVQPTTPVAVRPRGLVRTRPFGLCASRRRSAALERCRELLGTAACVDPPEPPSMRCPACSGIMLVVERLTRGQLHFHSSLNLSNSLGCSVDTS